MNECNFMQPIFFINPVPKCSPIDEDDGGR